MKRVTKQRLVIEEIMSQSDQFCSAQEMHEALRREGHKIGLATVYRSLQAMAEAGEIDATRNEQGELMYRRCIQFEHHHHLICRSCHKSVEIAPWEIESWFEAVAKEHGFTNLSHSADIVGLCPECQKSEQDA